MTSRPEPGDLVVDRRGNTGIVVSVDDVRAKHGFDNPNWQRFINQGSVFVRFDRDVYDGSSRDFRAGEIGAFEPDGSDLHLLD